MYSTNQIEMLNTTARQYAPRLEASIKDVLDKTKNTGRGLGSVKVQVKEGTANASPELIVTLDQYVLYLDSSKLQWTKLPPIRELLAWARTVKSTEAEAVQLAWATAWDKKKNDTWKPKKWRRKSFSSVLRDMNEDMLEAFERAIDADFQQVIDKELK